MYAAWSSTGSSRESSLLHYCFEEDSVTTDDELAAAIADRLVQLIAEGATSDTVLKLAEAWAWVRSPGQPHGGFAQG